ncbi:MAG: glycoside hydrolase family 32 protein, partial [Pricia sp.]|nr:glycoside hydrolase family 32 protein [Pricia sp.]
IDLINYPIEQLETLIEEVAAKDISLVQGEKKEIEFANLSQSEIRFETSSRNFQLKIGNKLNEEVALTMNGDENTFVLDRTNAGQSNFQKDFAGVQQMPVHSLPDGTYEVRILIDLSSIEVFINKGQYAMTAQLFPTEPFTDLIIENLAEDQILLQDFKVSEVNRIW